MSGGPQVFLGATTFLSRCRQISGRGLACWAGLLGVPVGGGPPARRPRCELRSARRLEARPGPATARGHCSQAPQASRRPPIGRRRRPRAPQSGPAGLAAASNRAALGMTRPGPAVRPRRPRDDRLLNNVARNSRASISNTEIASLELQRFEHILKTDRCKLRATFVLADVVASSQR